MGAADQRVAELLERWMASVDLHARYLALDDAAYARVQDWPKHQRPTRRVLDLARNRLLELRRIVGERNARGDAGFAEALELMALLTNLLGSQHVDRFIPLAQPPAAPPATRPPAAPAAARRAAATSGPPAAPKPAPKPASKPAPVAAEPAAIDKATATVIGDAVRLLSWGREWPQLAGLIARLANRPAETDVWKILRRHRAAIETRARRPRD